MPIFICAELGINHDGSLDKAKRLIDSAKSAGASGCKFQMFNSHRLWGDGRIAHLELNKAALVELANHAKQAGIEFLCTPFGIPEVDFLAPLVKRMKIASGCIARYDLLAAVRKTKLPVILSTGMSDLDDIRFALKHLGPDVTLLHCTSSYPCPINAVNLKAIDTLRMFHLPVGYSDHTASIVVPIAAAARGAVVIEKHLTLDRNAAGPDHRASIEPAHFRVMVDGIRRVELALGDGVKRPQACELPLRKLWHGALPSHRKA